MNKRQKHLRMIIAIILVAVFVLGILAVAVPAFSAIEADGEEEQFAELGASHRAVSLSDLPASGSDNLRTDAYRICLDSYIRYMSINERSMIKVLDAYSHTVNNRSEFTSSKPSVVSVSANGTLTAKSAGVAQITVKDRLTGLTAVCTVNVGREYAPTEPSSPKPTDEPTEVPQTLPPTQSPTQPATQPPQPTSPPATQPPTDPPVTNITLSLDKTSATVYAGNYYHVAAVSNATISYSSSNTSIATVDSKGIVTTYSTGTVKITASAGTKSAVCTLKVVNGSSVDIYHSSISVARFMTFRTYSDTYGVTWSSDDPSIATVDRGFVYGVKSGTTVIRASTSSGAATCVVTVNPSNPVRFAYTSPNCAAKNQTVTLICITDTMRTGVRFEVTENGSTRYVNAVSKTKDGDTYIWKGMTSFSTAGTHKIKAYSQYNGGTTWSSHHDGETTAFVTATSDSKTTVCAERRASNEVIDLMATFEGFLSEVYDDYFTGDPTVGYGRVIFIGESFYNNLTKNEAFAYLVQTVNNDGYADGVNEFLIDHEIKYNQQQFDALVCFVYNCGLGPLYNDDDLIGALLDCYDGSGSVNKTYYINADYVRIRKGPGTDYDIIDELAYNTTLKILNSSSSWWQVQLTNGTKGYVLSDYISSRSSGGTRDFNYINKNNFIKYFCQFHHAGGCVWGLLYRRVDEVEIFFYNDFEPCYGDYKYPIDYTCPHNSAYSIHAT